MTHRIEPLVSPAQVRQLRSAIGTGDKPLLIAIHDYPDPDAIAAALAMQTLARSWGINSAIAHGGIIGREDNSEMVRLLKINLQTFASIPNLTDYRGALLVDTQPAARNQSLPGSVPVLAVVDHHRLSTESIRLSRRNSETAAVRFSDIRINVGSSSTLLFYYLQAAGIVPDARLATALFLGIKTDTDGLLRYSVPCDIQAYAILLSLADLSIAGQATHPPQDPAYYRFLHGAMERTGLYGSSAFADCGTVKTPDHLSMASDFLIPLRDVQYALAAGFHGSRLYLSLRSKAPNEDATQIMLAVVALEGKGGGHNLAAGGFVELSGTPEECLRKVLDKFLAATGDAGTLREGLIC